MWLAIGILFFMLLVAYLLLMPIIVSINTEKNEYFIQLKGIARASIEPDEDEIIRIKFKVFFMKFYFFPIDEFIKRNKAKKEKPKIPKTHKVKRKKHLGINRGLQFLKTFKVKQFTIDLDTGDVIQNAKLYPAFAFLNYYKGGFNINFEGRNRLVVQLQNRPIDLISVFINP